jgi:hypothetical protein
MGKRRKIGRGMLQVNGRGSEWSDAAPEQPLSEPAQQGD